MKGFTDYLSRFSGGSKKTVSANAFKIRLIFLIRFF